MRATFAILLLCSSTQSFADNPSFWRVAKDDHGICWFIRPDGTPEFMNCVQSVNRKIKASPEPGKPPWDFVSTLWDGKETDDSLKRWTTAAVAEVKSEGFKGIGAWSDWCLHNGDLPMSRDLNIWLAIKGTMGRGKQISFLECSPFDPQFAPMVDRWIADEMRWLTVRDNTNLVGYYLDNEIPWSDEVQFGANAYFTKGPGSFQRAEVLRVIRNVWHDLDSFNKDWNVSIKSFDELADWKKLPAESNGSDKLRYRWLHHLATEYFRITTVAVRKYDPNHLILGIRFHPQHMPDAVIDASADFVDANSFNYYPDGTATLPQKKLDLLRRAGKPIIISEFSYYSNDNRSYDTYSVDYDYPVRDQAARGALYAEFTRSLAKQKDIIGADWFQWSDEPPSGKLDNKGEHVNFGVVDMFSRPYEPLVDQIRKTTPLLNDDHRAAR